jgi:hypothetical protein
VRVDAPSVNVQGRVKFSFVPDDRRADISPADLPDYRSGQQHRSIGDA